MLGPKVHLFAAAVLTVVGTSSADAGGLFTGGCCRAVNWGCQSTCGGYPNIMYGTGYGYGYGNGYGYGYPGGVYPVNQGPVYEPPVAPYGVAGYAPDENVGGYPYVGGYGYPYTFPGYRRHAHFGYRGYGYPGYGYRGGYGVSPRYGAGYRYGAGFRYGARWGVRTAGYRQGFVGNRPGFRGPMYRPMVRGYRR